MLHQYGEQNPVVSPLHLINECDWEMVKLIGGESHLIEEMDPQALLNQIQYMINGVEERMERILERLKNLIGERDEHGFKVPHHRPRNVNNNRRIEEQEKLVNKVMLKIWGGFGPHGLHGRVERNGWLLRVVLSLLKSRCTLVKMELIGRAKLHWQNVELLLKRRRQPPITDWIEMKENLKEKYLPFSHQAELLDD